MKKIRLGVVGAGGIVRNRHAPGWRGLSGVEVVAVCNSTVGSARAFAAEFCPEARIFDDWEALVGSAEVDVVWIGATPHLHEVVTVAALEAGKHVFCQARMATDLAAARRMLEAARQRPDLVTMLCPPPFGLAEDAQVRRVLAESGRVRQVRLTSWDDAWLDPQAPLHWRQRVDRSGKNIMTLGIYTEVLQRWFGLVERVAAEGKIVQEVRPGGVVERPDLLNVGVTFAGGISGQWSFSGVYPGLARQELEIVTEQRVLHFDFLRGKLESEEGGKRSLLEPEAGELRPWRVEADFIEAVRNPQQPRPQPDFQAGVEYMAVVEAVDRALASRKWEVVI